MSTEEPVSAPLRRLGASLLALSRIRLELLAIEAQEEKDRIASLLLWAVLAALLAGFGLLMAVLLVTVALWDEHRLLALGCATLVLVVAAVVAVRKVRSLVALPSTLFQASIAELREDADALRRPPGP
ncbi:phage holin family protein [Roseateles saccharophilus]|uniref:Putative membrane protein YqjE n=1 Tax=Roseateles saccharophilus TaxID=304 RepID=A0A4R3UMQ5_ROSSA|nr:phage holin family protein [Roseateles saccharophilus]TCU91901.1 putative membrane protein YqjE [Roseateles saccharophilus]